MKTRTFTWHSSETNDTLTQTYDEQEYGVAPLCPLCNQQTEWWEGTVEQDVMGNDIDAGHFTCYSCRISTDLEYLD